MTHLGATPLVACARMVASGVRPSSRGAFCGHDDDGRGGIVDAGSVAGGDGAIFFERGLEGGEGFERGVCADAFVVRDDGGRCPFLSGDSTGTISASKRPSLLCGGGVAMGLERVGVLLLAGDAVLLGDEFAGHAHVPVFAGAPQAVLDHGVDGGGIAHAQAFARVGSR